MSTRQEQALHLLHQHQDGLSKSQLAFEIYGEITGSTQALVSRLTKQLMSDGYVQESKVGRSVIVQLSADGVRYLKRQRQEGLSWASIMLSLRKMNRTASGSEEDVEEDVEEHPWDRPLVYLRIAARLSANRLAEQPEERKGDCEFGRALLAIIDSRGDGDHTAPDWATNSKRDKELFSNLVSTWPSSDSDRLGIIEATIRFQDPDETREGLAADLLRLGSRLAPGHADSLLWLAIAVPEASRIGLSYTVDGSKAGDPAIRNALFELVSRHVKDSSDYSAAEKCLVHYQKGRVARSLARMTEATKEWQTCHSIAQNSQENTETSQTIRVSSQVNAILAELDSHEWLAVDKVLRRWADARRYVYEYGRVPVREAIAWAVEHRETLAGEWFRAIEDVAAQNQENYRMVFESLRRNFQMAGVEHRLRIRSYLKRLSEATEPFGDVPEKVRQVTLEDEVDKFVKSVLNNSATTPMIWGAIAAGYQLATGAN